jgi:hypothetical protein
MNTGLRSYLIGTLLSLCTLAGCEKNDRLNTCLNSCPVEGKLFIAGVPAGNANVYFYPCDPGRQRIPVAITAPDGTFRLTTIRPGDGAPAGRYDVTVIWPDYSIPRDECADPLHDRLKLQYADRSKTELHAVVSPGKNEVTLRVATPGGGWSFPRRRDTRR